MAASAGDCHPFPIYNARFRLITVILDADGDLVTGAASLDSEASQDTGTFADCTNEATEIATSSGMYYLDLVAGELDTKSTAIIIKTATAGAKTTPVVLYPKRLPIIRTGTAQAGGASTITLDSGASALTNFYAGCYVNITNNSPSNAQGQARRITSYNGSTKVATVEAAWGTNPDSSSTFEILAPGDSVNVANWAGNEVSTPTNAGVPNVNAKTWNDLATVALPLVPTTAGRTLDVSATGEGGVDWANVGSPTSINALTNTTINTTQKVDVDTIKTNPVVNAGTITFPTTATLASTTNITAGTITTVTNLTNAPTAGDLTATMKTSVTTACTASTPTAAAVTGAVGSVTGNVGGNVTGSVGSVVGAVGSVTGAVGSVTGAVGSVTGAVGSVTGNVGGNVTGSVGSLATQAKADVNAEVLDVIATDTHAEVGQETPAATQTILKMQQFLYKAWRNKSDQSATTYQLYADDATTVDQKATVSDSGTVFTSGEKATGP